MRKRGRIIRFTVIAIVLGGFAWWAFVPSGPPDPVYDGHPLSVWLRGDNAEGCARSLDSKAVPYLVATLTRHDGLAGHAYQKIWPRLPNWLRERLYAPRSAASDRYIVCSLLGTLGAGGRPAIPALVRVAKEDEDLDVRFNAANALDQITNRDGAGPTPPGNGSRVRSPHQ
jgi:hypothetical protein